MGLVFDKDQFAKIPVMGDDRPLFPIGNREDRGIGIAYWIVASNTGDVMPQT